MSYGNPLDPSNAPQREPQRVLVPLAPGQILDPSAAPAKPASRPTRSRGEVPVNAQDLNLMFGTSVNVPVVPQQRPTVLRTVALGYTTGAEAPQLPPGVSSRGSNFIASQGGLTPRSGLTALGTTNTLMWLSAGWVGESMDSLGSRFPVVLSAFSPAWYSNGSWSALSQTGASSNTLSANTTTNPSSFIDAAVYYNPDSDNFELAFCFPPSDYGLAPFTFRATQPTFSTLTNAPKARYVAAFDSRLLFAHVDAGTNVIIPQRVQWSVRGNPSLYTAPDGGFEDLLDMRGSITRLIAEDDRVVVFAEDEIWQGEKIAFPFNFQFRRIESAIGCQASWSVARTPKGLMFLGSDLDLYLMPKGGLPQPVGAAVKRYLQGSFVSSYHTLATGGYVDAMGAYVLTWPTATGTQGVMVTLMNGTAEWSPVGFDLPAGTQIRRWGESSALGTAITNAKGSGPQRVLVVDNGTGGNNRTNVMEFTSAATSDMGAAIDCRYFALLPNPNPTERQIVTEVRVDYRGSASSMSLRLSGDFGTTYPVDTALALPTAPVSAQTVVGVGLSAVYPAIEFRVASGHTPTIQGLSAIVQGGGNG